MECQQGCERSSVAMHHPFLGWKASQNDQRSKKNVQKKNRGRSEDWWAKEVWPAWSVLDGMYFLQDHPKDRVVPLRKGHSWLLKLGWS